MKGRKIAVCIIVCMAVLFVMPIYSTATSFDDITSDSIADKQNQIDQAENQRDELKNTLTDIKKIKQELETKKSDLKNYVKELDKNLETINVKIADLEALITQKENDITLTQAELEAAILTEESQYEAMKARIQFIYEEGDAYYLDLVMGADSFGDFLNRVDYVEQLSAYDRKMLDSYILNRQLIEACKRQLEADKALLDEAKETVVAEKEALEALIDEKTKQITAYESDINSKEKAIKEYEEDIKAQDELIQALEAAVAEEKKRLLEENGIVLTYDGGAFKFPVAKYTRISDDYGMRMHPTLHVEKFHNGVDLAAPTGTAIYAAYDGIVVASDYGATMGNYVMIDHGDGLYTIYMHASELYVKKGDIVVRGEKIAAVGSTGRSTGPHLHFGVRLNGSYVSPWKYLSK